MRVYKKEIKNLVKESVKEVILEQKGFKAFVVGAPGMDHKPIYFISKRHLEKQLQGSIDFSEYKEMVRHIINRGQVFLTVDNGNISWQDVE